MSISPNLKIRIISALVMAPAVLALVYAGGYWFAALILITAVLMSFEWNHIVSKAFYRGTKWDVVGVIYVVMPCLSLIFLRAQEQGLTLILWLLAVIWTTDTVAYFTGKAIGGPKLAPSISPKKTWAGLLGAIVGSAIVGLVTALIMSVDVTKFTLISAALAVVSQIGDLIESALKRHFDVKDSGSIIPGHGGILDRVDGVVTTAPLVVLIQVIWGLF